MSRLHGANGLRRRAVDEGLVSAFTPDWTRESRRPWQWTPARSLLASLRTFQRLRTARRPDLVVLRVVARWRHRMWSAVAGTDIPLECRIAGGLLLPHPNGVVIHPDAVVGANCLLFQQVTLGSGGPIPGVPTLEGHVDVGAGAKILGGVRIGAHATVGANAVVLCDVPAGATAVGIPARILPMQREPAAPPGDRCTR